MAVNRLSLELVSLGEEQTCQELAREESAATVDEAWIIVGHVDHGLDLIIDVQFKVSQLLRGGIIAELLGEVTDKVTSNSGIIKLESCQAALDGLNQVSDFARQLEILIFSVAGALAHLNNRVREILVACHRTAIVLMMRLLKKQ